MSAGDEGTPARRRGRRPAGEDTRAAILEAARGEFAARGYEGTTLRGIARAAGVDARLVHHYFDGKDEVFTAAMEFPVRPQDIVQVVLASGGVEGVARMVREFLVQELFGRLACAIGADRPQLRAALAGSQMVGLIMARFVVKVEPIASADIEEIIEFVAPTLQRYLAG